MNLWSFPAAPFFFALYLASSGIRKGSLSLSGGLAAFIVGFAMMAVRLRTFGVSLIVFYLAGSKATKVGKEFKAKLEEGHQAAGNRSGMQVLCNSFSAFVAALAWSAMFVPGSFATYLLSSFVSPRQAYDRTAWCPLSASVADGRSRALVFITLGHFACCLGDTLASELGILATSPPRLITTFKPVPPGTNGGMSITGTLSSAAGGLFMGLAVAVSLLVESSQCRTEWLDVLPSLLMWGTFAGFFGSLIDSFFGATIQRTKFSSKTKRIFTDEAPAPASEVDVKVISGFDILTNNQVNPVSSVLTALLVAKLAQ